MDKQDHNRINSIKARPTTAISLNSGEAQPSYDALAEIRDDYRRAKEQLKRYNKFIDNHKPVTVLIPLLLSCVAMSAANSGTSGDLGLKIGMALFVADLILICVCGWRGSSKAKIEHKMNELREEAAQYRRATALGEKNISRDELGLFQNDLVYSKGEEVSEESIGAIKRDDREIKKLLRQAGALANWSIVGLIIPIVAWILGGIALSKLRSVREDYLEDSKPLADEYETRASHIRNVAMTMITLSIIVSVVFVGYLYASIQAANRAQQTQACMTSAGNAYDPTVAGAAQTEIAELQAC
jgi:hypothetical protein